MSEENKSSTDWLNIIEEGAKGATSALGALSNYKTAKKEAKEAKRRTLANLMTGATRRNRNIFRKGQQYGDEMKDYQSQALQEVARGFAQALQGSTGRL